MSDEPTTGPASESSDSNRSGRFGVTVEWPTIDRERTVLWVVTFVLVAALLYVGWRYVGTLVMGIFVYYVTRPILRRVSPRFESRTVAVALTLLVVALPLFFIIGWTGAILVNSLSQLLESDVFGDVETFLEPYIGFTELVTEFGTFVEQVLADPSRLADINLGSFLGGALTSLLEWLGVAVTAGIQAFIVIIVVFYLLRDDYRIAQWARTVFVEDGGELETYFETVDRDLHNVYFGNILNALLTGILAATVYTLLNLAAPSVVRIPEAAFLGVLVGAASLIPVIGIKLVTWPVGGYLLARALWFDPQALWFPAVFFAVSFVIVDYIPDQLLRPYVSGRTLHVGAVMLAYTIGPLLFGWYGIFLAPLLFVATFEFGRILFPWLVNPERFPIAPQSLGTVPDDNSETEETNAGETNDDERSASTEEDRRTLGPADGARSVGDESGSPPG